MEKNGIILWLIFKNNFEFCPYFYGNIISPIFSILKIFVAKFLVPEKWRNFSKKMCLPYQSNSAKSHNYANSTNICSIFAQLKRICRMFRFSKWKKNFCFFSVGLFYFNPSSVCFVLFWTDSKLLHWCDEVE